MIIKNIDDIKKHIPLNTNEDIAKFAAQIDRAEQRYLKPVIGLDLYTSLDEYINAEDPTADKALDAIKPLCIAVVANFCYFLSIPQLDVVSTDAGFAVVSNANQAPASTARVEKLQQSIKEAGFDAIEALLEFLETNKDDYDEWTSSDAYTMQEQNIINSAAEFSKYLGIENKRLLFARLRDYITTVEDTVLPTYIGSGTVEYIKEQIKETNPDDAVTAILRNLKYALVNFTIAELPAIADMMKNTDQETSISNFEPAILSEQKKEYCLQRAVKYIGLVTAYMSAHLDDFEYYRDNVYRTDAQILAADVNTDESKIFVFGGAR